MTTDNRLSNVESQMSKMSTITINNANLPAVGRANNARSANNGAAK